MIDHERALQKALLVWLKADPALQALLGDPARVWDAPPDPTDCPHLRLGDSGSRPVAADGCGFEHRLTLHCVSDFRGTEEARAVAAAVRVRLQGAVLEADGIRTVDLTTSQIDVTRSPDLGRTYAAVRVRAVTEAEAD